MLKVVRAKCSLDACFLFLGGAPRVGLSSWYFPAKRSGVQICLTAAHNFINHDTPGVRGVESSPRAWPGCDGSSAAEVHPIKVWGRLKDSDRCMRI